MKHLTIVAIILAFLLGMDVSHAVPEKKTELKDITLTGIITKVEKKTEEKTTVTYVLTDEKGNKINLPKPKVIGVEKAINLDDYVDAKVKLVGKGMETQRGGERKIVTIIKIVSVEKVIQKDVKASAEEEVVAPAEEDVKTPAEEEVEAPAEDTGEIEDRW